MTFFLLFVVLVLLPATIAWLLGISLWHRSPDHSAYDVGVPVIYRHEEVAPSPAPNAQDIRPTERGEDYHFSIVNYLRVAEVLGDGRVIAVARNNERLCFWPDDSSFRRARLTERLIYRPRFPRF